LKIRSLSYFLFCQAIFKRAVDHSYSLKLKAARSLLSEVYFLVYFLVSFLIFLFQANKKFSTVPFSTRNLTLDERQGFVF